MSDEHIFISYRHDDSEGFTRAIYNSVEHFFKGRVFMDVEGIEPGLPFDEAIKRALGKCEVLLVMIGKRWLEPQVGGGSRINDPNDSLHLEIAEALSRKIRVIPVLIEGARMPDKEAWPEPLREMAVLQAIEVSNTRFNYDVERLIGVVQRALGDPQGALGSTNSQLDTLERVGTLISTHFISQFPKFIPQIVDLINSAEERLIIFCDIPAYGNFSDPHNFKAYRRAIEDTRERKVLVELICLDHRSRLASYDEVIEEWPKWKAGRLEKLREFLWERKRFWIDRSSLGEEENKVDSLTKHEFEELLETANREMLEGPLSTINIVEIVDRIPAFFWLADGRNAIFAIPAYTNEHTELGFATSDRDLINALLAIRDRFMRLTTSNSVPKSAALLPDQQSQFT